MLNFLLTRYFQRFSRYAGFKLPELFLSDLPKQYLNYRVFAQKIAIFQSDGPDIKLDKSGEIWKNLNLARDICQLTSTAAFSGHQATQSYHFAFHFKQTNPKAPFSSNGPRQQVFQECTQKRKRVRRMSRNKLKKFAKNYSKSAYNQQKLCSTKGLKVSGPSYPKGKFWILQNTNISNSYLLGSKMYLILISMDLNK